MWFLVTITETGYNDNVLGGWHFYNYSVFQVARVGSYMLFGKVRVTKVPHFFIAHEASYPIFL